MGSNKIRENNRLKKKGLTQETSDKMNLTKMKYQENNRKTWP